MSEPLDCRSEAGETVGLIDGAIHVLRIVSRANLHPPAVVEAMRDFTADPEVQAFITHASTTARSPIA